MDGGARNVIVTGAARGIGRGMVEAFLDARDRVAGFDLDADGLASIADPGNHFEARQLDVADIKNLQAAIDDFAVRHGSIDVLINNAGVTRRADLMDLTEEDWDRILTVNGKAVFFGQQAAARQMLRQGSGCIINIASIAGRGYPDSSNAIYAASKGAVIAMTRMAAHRLGPSGITVNAICPGITETEIFQGIVARDAEARGVAYETVHAEKLQNVPIRRANTITEVAEMALYLASPAARNITGQAMHIDGGLIMP
ncbi:MAG: SDR family NAD(P)-dependent oxidoreductase [Pseudomonadota bacterium]